MRRAVLITGIIFSGHRSPGDQPDRLQRKIQTLTLSQELQLCGETSRAMARADMQRWALSSVSHRSCPALEDALAPITLANAPQNYVTLNYTWPLFIPNPRPQLWIMLTHILPFKNLTGSNKQTYRDRYVFLAQNEYLTVATAAKNTTVQDQAPTEL